MSPGQLSLVKICTRNLTLKLDQHIMSKSSGIDEKEIIIWVGELVDTVFRQHAATIYGFVLYVTLCFVCVSKKCLGHF